jgi:hypothetical protein
MLKTGFTNTMEMGFFIHIKQNRHQNENGNKGFQSYKAKQASQSEWKSDSSVAQSNAGLTHRKKMLLFTSMK